MYYVPTEREVEAQMNATGQDRLVAYRVCQQRAIVADRLRGR